MTSVVPAFRTFVLAFLILAGSLGAAFAMPAQEAAASGPCDVWSAVRYGISSTGRYYVYGRGVTDCDYRVYQAIEVNLYKINSAGTYTLLQSSGYEAVTNSLARNTSSVWMACGVKYRTRVSHIVDGDYITRHWSGFFIC